MFFLVIHNMFSISNVAVVLVTFSMSVEAQYFPPSPEGITSIKSSLRENAIISYKEVCQQQIPKAGSDCH